MREEALEQRRRGCPVDVVVAEDRHLLPGGDGVGQAGGSLFHIRQRGRIGQQVADCRVEKAFRLAGQNAAPGEYPRDDVRHAVALCNGERHHVLPLVQPMLP